MIPALLLALAQITATPQQAVGFDYRAADITMYEVTRCEASWDAGPWVSIGMPPVYSSTNGVNTYAVSFPALAPNVQHTVSLRLCNTGGCSTPFGPLAFTYVVVPPEGFNLRLLTIPK